MVNPHSSAVKVPAPELLTLTKARESSAHRSLPVLTAACELGPDASYVHTGRPGAMYVIHIGHESHRCQCNDCTDCNDCTGTRAAQLPEVCNQPNTVTEQ